MRKFFNPVILVIAFFISAAAFAQPGANFITTVKQIAAGSDHNVVLLTDGSIWTWGENTGGQLGVKGIEKSAKAIRIGNENNWTVISAGQSSTHAIKADGTLWGWGINKIGQLGISTENFKYALHVPTQVGKDKDWQMVSSGSNFTIGLKTDGSIWVWGVQVSKLLSREIGEYEPIKIADKNNNDWKQIAAGDEFLMAMKKDGTIWTMGLYRDESKTFVKINDDTDWVSMDAGRYHAMAIKNDGSLWGWGDNSYGQLGNGTKESSKVPVKVVGDFKAVTATENYTAAIRKSDDNVLWWGQSWPVKLEESSPVVTGKTSFYPLIAASPKGLIIIAIDNVLVWEYSINKNYGGSMKTLK